MTRKLVEEAIDVILNKAKDPKDPKDSPYSSPAIEATSGGENLRFDSPYEFRLFQLLPIIREMDPVRAEGLLRDVPNLKTVMAKFPQGQASLGVSPTGEKQDVYYHMNFSRTSPPLMLSEEQRRAGDVSRLVSLSKTDPMTAITQAILLPDAERGEALVSIARANLHEGSTAAQAMAAYLKLPADRSLSEITAWRAVEALLDLHDPSSAETALKMLLKVADLQYKEDSDAKDPNTALKATWRSTHTWAAATRTASRISPDAGFKAVNDIPDPEVKTLAKIELAAALLKLPPTGIGATLTIHKQKK